MQTTITDTPVDLVSMFSLQPGCRYVVQSYSDPVRLMEQVEIPAVNDGVKVATSQVIEVSDEPWWCWVGGLGSAVSVHMTCATGVLGKGHKRPEPELVSEPGLAMPDVVGDPPVRRGGRPRLAD